MSPFSPGTIVLCERVAAVSYEDTSMIRADKADTKPRGYALRLWVQIRIRVYSLHVPDDDIIS